MGIVLATGYRHESKPPGEERQSFMREGRASDRLGKKRGRPSERSFRGLVSDPSFFPKLSESDRSEQEIEESSLIDVN
ncbi:hypothetical protein LguiA_035963 [Lonicera macranthoides]